MVTSVSATGLKSFKVDVSGFFGTGLIMEDTNERGTTACVRNKLKMSVYTSASSSAQAVKILVLRQVSQP